MFRTLRAVSLFILVVTVRHGLVTARLSPPGTRKPPLDESVDQDPFHHRYQGPTATGGRREVSAERARDAVDGLEQLSSWAGNATPGAATMLTRRRHPGQGPGGPPRAILEDENHEPQVISG